MTRHEVSRWERQVRVPGPFWLSWLATVLGVPLDTLTAAHPATYSSTPAGPPAPGGRDKVM